MPWAADSRRRSELPPDWPATAARILRRDQHQCQIRGPRCTGHATEVDHIGDRHDHSDTNLRAACHACHAQRSAHQGGTAAAAARTAAARHPREQHPGLGPPTPG